MKKNHDKIINPYLDKYPELSLRALAKLIYKENPLLFTNENAVRANIQYRKGSIGQQHRKYRKDDKYFKDENIIKKYNLPEAIETEYLPYKITGNKVLIFGDVHIPFHSIQAIETMFNFTIDKNIDTVIINGDFADCFDISNFVTDPTIIDFDDERNKVKEFLKELKIIYPNANIYYKFGNHESRFEKYLITNAPKIFKCKEFRLEILYDLFNIGIEYIQEDKYIVLNNNLNIIHGHEYKNGITSPANPARTTFLRTKASALSAHNHQTSEHTESRIDGDTISCWSIGCLCGLNPKYMPLNKWNHGFAIYTKDDDKFWHVQNKKIIKGRVV